jgi:FlaA1/EpsC-like NDP-sugar epimerase
MLLTRQNTPRWLIFLIDLSIITFSVILAFLLRFNFQIPPSELKPLPQILLYMVIIRGITFLFARTYAGIIRYTSTADALRVSLTLLAGSIVFALTNVGTYLYAGFFFIPFSVIIIDLLAGTFGMVTFRIIVKMAYIEFQHPSRDTADVIIYGAGEAGITAKRVLSQDSETKYSVKAFIDEDPAKIGKKLEGVDIMPPAALEKLLSGGKISQVILAIPAIDAVKKQAIVDRCLQFNTRVLAVPPVIRWINGELSFKQIRNIGIEELLERDEIRLDEEKIASELRGRVVMITGAAGSIGSEIVRQVGQYTPGLMVLVDQAETPLHFLELECNALFPDVPCRFVLSDIRNGQRSEQIFKEHIPDIVYHAAAYKHVPVMEQNPHEAILTNVMGTKIMADLAIQYHVKKFIMVSTDKAVNPTGVMGASKRIAEIYTQSLNGTDGTRFITTRFGNVLGSSGSVIPIFRQQIEKGGPLTITHPEVTRFFMTIHEACHLVLEAGSMGKGGEIFLFDMGQPVRILDLAKKMIQLSGLELGKDIQISFCGLRPGEKLYEELLNKEENTLPTHHPLIMIARVREYDPEKVAAGVDALIALAAEPDPYPIVSMMKNLVPEFISQNSDFGKLDS